MRKGDLAVGVPTPNAMTPEPTPLLRHVRSYPGREDQLPRVRAFLRDVLAGLPGAGDAVRLASAFSANARLHSRSGIPGGVFTVRAEASEGGYLYIAVEDEGGPWNPQAPEAPSRHGLDVAEGIAGAANWGITGDAGGRLAWARLLWPRLTPATMPALLC